MTKKYFLGKIKNGIKNAPKKFISKPSMRNMSKSEKVHISTYLKSA
jgi:hypothetical protein